MEEKSNTIRKQLDRCLILKYETILVHQHRPHYLPYLRAIIYIIRLSLSAAARENST